MDKILSARVDETIISQISLLAKEMHQTKKAIIEAAIEAYVEKMALKNKINLFSQSFGAWQGEGTTHEAVENNREKMNQSMLRHQR